MPKEVIVAKAAKRDIKKLDQRGQRAIIKALAQLELNPRPPNAEKLNGHPPFWRVRVGDYRVIYTIEKEGVVVLLARNKKDAYKGLDSLDNRLAAALVDLAETVIENDLRDMPAAGSA